MAPVESGGVHPVELIPGLLRTPETLIFGGAGANVDGGGAVVVAGGLDVPPPLKTRCSKFASGKVGLNCEAGMMLYPGSPGWLMVCGTADESPPPGSILD